MGTYRLLLLLLSLSYSCLTYAQEQSLVASESRDTALAYIGTSNFIVASIANRCSGSFRDGKSPKEFVLMWQERNASYLVAAAIYMEKRLAEAYAGSGPEERAALYEKLTAESRANGEAAVRNFFEKNHDENACSRALGFIADGIFDVTPKIPVYDELEELAAWAQQQ